MPRPRRKTTKHDAVVRCIERCHRAMTTCYRHWNVQPSDMRMILAVLATMHGYSNLRLGLTVEQG